MFVRARSMCVNAQPPIATPMTASTLPAMADPSLGTRLRHRNPMRNAIRKIAGGGAMTPGRSFSTLARLNSGSDPERPLVDVDDGHQQREHQGPDEEADKAERLQAAEDRKEQRN